MGQKGYRGCYNYSTPSVDRTWDTWGSYSDIAKTILYLLKRDYIIKCIKLYVLGLVTIACKLQSKLLKRVYI